VSLGRWKGGTVTVEGSRHGHGPTFNFLQFFKKVDRDVNNSDRLESIWLKSDSFDVVSFMFWSNTKVNASKSLS
jgi:hypothetical protein